MRELRGYDHGVTFGRRLMSVNWLLVLVVSVLVAVGTATLYSVEGGSFDPWAKAHGVRFLVGLAIILTMISLPMSFWRGLAPPFYVVSLALLALVPLAGVEALGARRWLAIGDMTFQPTELMKVSIVLALAYYYASIPSARVSELRHVALPLLLIAVPVLLTLRQPDLGSAVLLAAIGLGMMFLAGVSVLYFAIGALAGIIALPIIWTSLHDYQRRRIEIFLDPERDPLGGGYHITQSKIALGSGGVGGKGFMEGTQSQLDFLPEKHTDFIFTTFAEEWGFMGAMGLLALYGVLLVLLARMAMRAESHFCRLLIAGTWLTISLYVVINVAMVTGIIPVVGVPLPFVSYGGTSMVSLMASLGLAITAGAHRDRPSPQSYGGSPF